MKKRFIFDTLPCAPDGAEITGDADTGRIRELVHKGLEEQKTLHHSKKRRRFLPLIAVAVALIVAVSVSIVVNAELYVSPEQEMKEKLNAEYNEKKEYYRNHLDEVSNPLDIEFEEMDIMTRAMLIVDKINEDEREQITGILNKYGKNDNYNIRDSHYTNWTVEEYDDLFCMIIDCCGLYYSDDITLEEKIRIYNFLKHTRSDYTIELGFNQLSNKYKGYNNSVIEKLYPEEFEHWIKALELTNKILQKGG